MNHSNSRLAHGTSGSPQMTIENAQAEQKAKDNEQSLNTEQVNSDTLPYIYNHDEVIKAVDNKDDNFLRNKLSQTSPIAIPTNATIKPEPDRPDYKQVRYKWDEDGYKYESRWHTHTKNAPEYSQDTWVVTRTLPGIPAGKNARKKELMYLIKDDGWIPKEKWEHAKALRKQGKETEESRRILDNGHWNAER